ncbi:MAG: menaquinol oxidoreductase [Deltaproteobacteria bacterium]|nr:MAG: menaquinol oxidoreductase [Deltaproteobacteria bacterium]
MNAHVLVSLIAVVVLGGLAYAGGQASGLQFIFGVILPYMAVTIFVFGFTRKIIGWGRSAVPFAIPTTCGQQKSFSWINQAKVDNPSTKLGVVIRMVLEITVFRSLFRNTLMEVRDGGKLSYEWEKWLWIAALAFHYSFLVVLLRHMRFFFEPVPAVIKLLEALDGFLQIGLPGLFMSGFVLLGAALYLFVRRMIHPQVNYISLAADYFPLFLIMAIALTGIRMRYVTKVDIVAIKSLTMGLVTLNPTIPDGVSPLFFTHLFLVCVLLAYFPFSKLMHMGGVFMSPTRNMLANTREYRHVNPWNYPVKKHTYEEYEDDFREKMIEAGLPVEKE